MCLHYKSMEWHNVGSFYVIVISVGRMRGFQCQQLKHKPIPNAVQNNNADDYLCKHILSNHNQVEFSTCGPRLVVTDNVRFHHWQTFNNDALRRHNSYSSTSSQLLSFPLFSCLRGIFRHQFINELNEIRLFCAAPALFIPVWQNVLQFFHLQLLQVHRRKINCLFCTDNDKPILMNTT